jgi:hypothetical protein
VRSEQALICGLPLGTLNHRNGQTVCIQNLQLAETLGFQWSENVVCTWLQVQGENGMGKLYRRSSCWLMAVILANILVFWSVIASAESVGVVYHIDDTRNGRFALHLAEDHLSINPDMQIAVVAYAAGVDFLLKGAEDKRGRLYKPDVQALMEKGVQFRVCSATLGFRDIAPDRVLDGIKLVPSGTYEIIRWQSEEGFVYLKP